jgi:hypothetical protein
MSFRSQGEVFAQRSKGSPVTGLLGDEMEDQAANQGFGFLIPVCLSGEAWFIVDESVGQRACVFGDIKVLRVKCIERVEGGRG